jgi:phosphate-selective porin OprO/OprP
MIRKHSFRGAMAGFAASALALAVSAQAFAGTVTTDGADIVVKTKGGLEVSTVDKEFSFKLGGKLQWDVTNFDGLRAANEDTPFDDTFNSFIRRGEISLEGTAYKNWGYGFRLSHNSDDGTNFDRAFFTYGGLDFVDLTIGKFGADYGLENTTSSSWITGIERPFMYDFLNGDEDIDFGVSAMHTGANYGLMARVATYGNKSDNDEAFGYTLRANFAPYLDGNNVVHLGANYHSNNPDDDRARVRTRMGLRSDGDERVEFTDTRVADSDTEWVLEAGAQFGGLRAQAEYFQRKVEGETLGGDNADVDVDGYYAQIGYMFNGVRGYKAGAGKWDKPSEAGAVEVFARYENSTIDGDAASVVGDMIGGVTPANISDEFEAKAMVVGINYFPTKAVRMSLNYVDYEVDNIDTSAQIDGENVQDDGKAIVGRLQYVF